MSESYQTTQAVSDAFAVRYVTAAGVVLMFYDHLLTIADEYQFIWKAPNTLGKYAFLFNRYLISGVMLVTLHEMAGFNNASFTDTGCRALLIVSIFSGTVTCIIGNLLMLHRILELWKNYKTKVLIHSLHAASACVHIAMTTFMSVLGWKQTHWTPKVGMCTVSLIPASFPIMWGAPLLFEVGMIMFIVYDTLATPRSATVPLRRALQSNGLLFFLAVIILRLPNVVVSALERRSISMFGAYFVWTGTTIFFNRSMLRMHAAEVKHLQRFMSCFEDAPLSFECKGDMRLSRDMQTDTSSDSYSQLAKDFSTPDSASERSTT